MKTCVTSATPPATAPVPLPPAEVEMAISPGPAPSARVSDALRTAELPGVIGKSEGSERRQTPQEVRERGGQLYTCCTQVHAKMQVYTHTHTLRSGRELYQAHPPLTLQTPASRLDGPVARPNQGFSKEAGKTCFLPRGWHSTTHPPAPRGRGRQRQGQG